MKKSLLLSLLAAGMPAAAQQAAPGIYEISLLSENKAIEINVNGFPLAVLPEEGNQGSLETLLSPYLKTGGNQIRVNTRPLVSAGGDNDALLAFRCVRKPAIDSDARTVVFEIERTDNPSAGQPNSRTVARLGGGDVFSLLAPGGAGGDTTILDFAAPAISSGPRTDGVSQLVVSASFADAPLAALPWEGAAVELADADRAAIRAKTEELHQAVAERDFGEIARLLDAKYTRMATALGVPKEELVASETALISQFLGKPEFVIQPFDPASLVFEPIPGVNLVRVRSGNDGPIRGADADVVFSLTPWFSKSGGAWILVE